MNSSGRFSLLLVSVCMMMLTGLFLGATPAHAAVTSGRTSDYSTSFPSAGGPYIVAATWDADNSTLYVVFNEAVADAGTDDVEEDDFLPIGFSFAGGGATLNTQPYAGVGIPSDADRRVVAITGFTVTPTAGVDSLALATLADNVDADGFSGAVGAVPGPDHTRVPITLGPVCVVAEVDNDWFDLDGDMDDVMITLTFNVDIQGPAGGAYVDADFDTAPELVKLPNDPIIDFTFANPNPNQLTLVRTANGHMRGMWPGITKIYVDATAVEDSDGATNSGCVAQTIMIENAAAGPALLGTHFRSTDGASGDLLLVFHEPVDPTSLAGVPGTQYTFPGGVVWGGSETQDLWTGTEFNNVVMIDGVTAIAGASSATLTVVGGNGPQDYQAEYSPAVTCSIKTAIGILRASYDRNGTPSTPDDDVLEMIFSEPFLALNAVQADDFHFAPNGTGELIDNIWSEVTISATNESGGGTAYGKVTVTDWQNATDLNGEPLPVGAFIKLDSGSNIKGTISGGVGTGAVNSSHWVPIVQDKAIWPAITTMVQEVDTYTTKYFDEGPTVATNDDIDHAFLAWREIGAADYADYWLLFFTNNGAGALTQVFIDTYLNDAIPISNIHSQKTDAGIVQRLQVGIAEGTSTTDGEVLLRGDEVWFMLVPMTYWGAIGPSASSLVFTKSFFVGPVCPPRDFITDVDEDMIHIRAVWDDTDLDGIRDADEYTRYIWGDANSAPCGTTIHVWRRGERDTTVGATELANGLIAVDGSFGPITLPAGANDEWALNLQAEEDGTYSDPVEILNDIHGVWLVLADGNGTGATDDDLILHPDRFNPHRRYTANEHINCLVKAEDGVLSNGGSIGAMNDLLVLSADFSVYDNRTALAAALGGDALTAVEFKSLGRDSLDNDGDWDDTSPNAGNGNGDMDYPEPYKDEDGDGYFTEGEWFQDNNGNGLCDAPHGAGGAGDPAAIVYDWYLDCTDEDEHGWYEIQLLTAAQYSGSVAGDSTCFMDVDKGFQLLDPVTDPTGLGPEGGWVLKNLPFTVQDTVMDAAMVYDETAATNDPPMSAMIDEVPVTETKIDELMTLAALTTDPAGGTNLILPTDPTYHLGRYVQFQATTPADNDVSFGVAQLYTQRSGSWAWETLVLDPPGTNAQAVYPGVQDFDDDGDQTTGGLLTNTIDDDEDGTVDEVGEGIDLSDPEVVDAMQASLAITTAAGVDTIWVSNDRIDNDNDAFFVMEVYWDENPATTTDVTQRITWYNIDEELNNNVDDDNDGLVDEADEVELYNVPASDDNEDGIMDGEAVALTLEGAHKRVVWDLAWAGDIYIDATHVLGQHPADFDGDVRASTEFIPVGHDVMRPNAILSTAFPGLGWGDTTTVTGVGVNALSWWDTHAGENVDFQYLAQLYDMAVDGTTEYKLRIVGYDHTGLGNSANSDSVTFTLDVTAPENLAITNSCDNDSTTAPADFVDVDPLRGRLQIYDSGSYTLTVENYDDAVSVQYYMRSSDDGGATWAAWATQGALDVSVPYTAEYAPAALDNNPAGDSLLVEFRAIGTDEFGNAQDPDSVCVLGVTVIDGTPPITWFSEIYNVVNPTDDAYWYRDTYGPVQVPVGPTIQLKAEFDDGDGVVGTNDVIRLVFDYRPVGVGGDWEHIMTYTGTVVVDPVTGDTLTIDFPGPIAVTLDTESMGAGSFDLRVYGCDFEGNCNILTPDMATITIVTEGLRAYIEDPNLNGGFQDLYAFNYIHDAEILTVEFQYYADTDGDRIDNDGNSWVRIAIDGGLTTAGDVLLRRGSDHYYDISGHQAFPAALGSADDEYFVDFDLNGYSDRDPVVTDTDGSGTWDTGEPVICGLAADLTNGQALTAFPADHFFTGADADFDATEWIFKDNAYGTGGLDLWYTQWDPTALSGDFLVRAVATDEYYAVDDSVTSPSVIPTRAIRIDPDPPYANITRVTKADGDTLDMTISMYVPGSTGWIMLEATSADTDIANVLFQYSTNGGGAWTDLDLNDDNDFYSDIDGVTGFQALGDDEIFLDDGDFVYGAGDVCIYDGGDLTIDTPLGTPLMPLITEDPAGGGDEDGDLMTDEDDNTDKKDYDEPYLIYFDFSAMNFLSNTDVLFQAVPTDQSGNVDAANATSITINIGETRPPETDIVSVYNADGDTLDVWKAIADGDGVMLLGQETGDLAFTAHVTAEDSTSISYVDLLSRWNATCYPDLEAWENPWESMSTAGYTTADSTYDYVFAIDMTGAADGAYEFFPMGVDGNGNMTPAPENPYAFRILNNRAIITTDLTGATYAVGDEVWFDATIVTTPPVEVPTVNFYYAERVLGEAVDPTRISQSSPYTSIDLDPVMFGTATAGRHAIMTINGVAGTWYESFTGLTGLTKLDWTMNGNGVQFGAPPAAGDTILVDYNITTWNAINAGDSYPPYSVAWDAGDGGIPAPVNAECEAYDIIATIDLGMAAGDECGLEETMVSELKYIYLTDESLPDVDLYMKGGRHAALETYYPGNPSFDTVGEGADTEWKISGIEAEAIAVQDGADPSVLTGVNLMIASQDTSYTYPMTLIPSTATMLYMTFTMYEEDYKYLAAGNEAEYEIENAWVALGGNNYQMAETVAGSGIWQVASVPVPVNGFTAYQFNIDMVGDDHGLVDDARNYNTGLADSRIVLPNVPFYYALLNTTVFGPTTSIWRAYTVATDEAGNVGTSMSLPFVYDTERPTVSELIADTVLFNETTDVDLWAECFDPTPSNLNIITVDEVVFQYCPNFYMEDGVTEAPDSVQVWLTLGVDTDPSDGWSVLNINIDDPGDDDYDNNNNGDWDEPAEDTVPMTFRAVPRDDGWNWGTAFELGFTLDSTEPAAVLTAPLEGSIFTYEQLITLTAEITETQADIEYISIQYSLDGTTWPALPYNPGAPGTGWVDPTPEDNSDNPYLYAAPYTTTLDPDDYPDFAAADRWLRFRAQAMDAAGNADSDPAEIIIVLDDITGPTAYPMWAATTGGAFIPINDPYCQITGTGAQIRSAFIDPTATGNIATVTVEYALAAADDTTWMLIEIIDLPAPAGWTVPNSQGTCDATWDVSSLPEGDVLVRSRAKDGAGNYGENPLVRTVTIDHTAPALVYDETTVGNGFLGFINYVAYVSDGVVGETSNVILPDPETGDVTFYLATPDPTVASITLQERTAGDAQGAWTNWAPGAPGATNQFMYEPNLNFQTDTTTYYVWLLRVHDLVDHPAGVAGKHELRGLAVDAAGNGNILHDANNPWSTWTIDTADPECVSMTHSLPADQVAAGDPVTFYFEGTDALTDIVVVRFEYDEVGGMAEWTVIDPDPLTPEIEAVDVTAVEETMDTDYPRWTAEITWTTPTYPVLTTDTSYNVRAVMFDSPLNNIDPLTPATCAIASPIAVEDMTPPMYTKMWAIPGLIEFDDDASGSAGAYDSDCENDDHDGVYVEINGTANYQANSTDVAIDYGDNGTELADGDNSDGQVGDGQTWPNYIDEDVITGNGLGEVNDILIGHEVVLVARTQLYDDGLERVEFWGTYQDAQSVPILIAVDECTPAYAMFTAGGPLWHGRWDTEKTDEHGAPIYPDGTWIIEPIAFDLAGNPEVLDGVDVATVIVDNTEPNATPDLNPLTTDVETGWGEWPEFTVERNGFMKLFARTESERDDDIVQFNFKRARDLNLTESWTTVPNSAGVDSSDLNPDYTRPYDFDWDLNKLTVPLAVGEKYDVACYSWDLVNNGETHLDAFEDERYVQFKIIDTIAPCATITSVKRRTGNRDIITMPEHYDMIYARDFEYLRATVLNYQNDCERVEFMYAPVGNNQPTLIDAQVTQYPNDPYTWQITNWDLGALVPGAVYEVFAVAVDDVGNMDFNELTGRPDCGGYFTLTVDLTGPTMTWVTPDPIESLIMKECATVGLSAALETGTSCYDHGNDETYGPSLASCGRIQVWGSYTGSVVDPTYTITITGGGTTFTWQKTGGSPVTGVAIDTDVYLADGVWVSFINGTDGAASFADDDIYTFTTQGRIYDLVFTSDDIDVDRDEVYWEYKKVEEPDGDEYWRFGSVFPYDVLYDGQTKMFSTSMDVSMLADGLYNLRLTVDDLSGNRTTQVMTNAADEWFVMVVDTADPTIALTNVVITDPAGGGDTVISPVDFGTPTDVTLGDVITLWATADDDEAGLPGDPDMYETGVTDIIFEASHFGGSSYSWQEVGFWHAPDETAIPLEVTASVEWNISGLWAEGIYVVRARAADELCNDEGYSAVVYLNIMDVRAPRARIAGFDPWTETHGDERKTFCDIYALAYCDAPITQVQFQYNETTNAVADAGWIPIGIPDRCEYDAYSYTDEVWKTTIELTETNFTVGDQFYLRAIATDDTPLQDEMPPWVLVEVIEYATGRPDGTSWSNATLDLMVVPVEGDDAILSDPNLTMQGGDEPEDAIVTVTTGDAGYDPHMLYIEPDSPSCADWVSLSRNIEHDIIWAGHTELERDNCGRMSFFASVLVDGGEAGACRIILTETDIWSHDVDFALGSNGTAWVPGYMSADAVGDTTATSPYLWAGVSVPPAATTDFDECLFLMKADAPIMSVDQERYLTLVPRSCYYIGFPYSDVDFDNGYYPTVTLQYDEAALMEVFGEDWAEKEPYLTPRVWDADGSVGDDSWWGESISHVTVHTELNQVTFHIDTLDREMPFFALFLPSQEAPVVVSTFRPAGPLRWGRHNYTDATPVITAYLHASSGDDEPIDEDTIELWIDGQIMASNGVPWVRGAGQLAVEQANPDATIYEIIYCHSFLAEDWLREGWHTLNILYKHSSGVEEWIELNQEAWGADFYVDTTPPVIEFDGGFVNNPVLRNVSGYVRAFETTPRAESMLKFQVKDLGGAGPYLRPEHTVWIWDVDCSDNLPPDPRHEYYEGTYYPQSDSLGCWTEVNLGIKYDLWLVDLYEDDQMDIDEFEERILLHTGTVDEMVPYMYPSYYVDGDKATYGPDSTLHVGIPIMAGGMVDDGDVLEVTLYSAKSIEQYTDSLQTYILYDTLYVGTGSPIVVFSGEYRTDRFSQEMHTYQYGVFDYAWNVGSDYIEKRFVVDSSPPQVSLLAPADGYTAPGEDFTFQVAIEDAKSGGGTVTWELIDAHGEVYAFGDGAEGTIPDLPLGEYTLKVIACDALGNETVMSIPIHAQSRVLGLTETYIYPNPFNPGDIEGMVHFNLSKGADITIKVYDFAGEFVRTLASGAPMDAGACNIPWGGQASDGTDLANGAYMIRVEANDGSTTKGATIKAVIWRE